MTAILDIQQLRQHSHAPVQVDVFAFEGQGGNPCPVVINTSGMDEAGMREVAIRSGHESAFVFAAQDDKADLALRFFVPGHEMSMCGHATIGTLWLLRALNILGDGRWRIQTQSGLVHALVDGQNIRISQPPAVVETLDGAFLEPVMAVLGLQRADLVDTALFNATTSRPKTLIQLSSTAALNRLHPQFDKMEALCEQLNSTGLYPFAVLPSEPGCPDILLEARQFPRSSGYPEDAATGIAAAALAGALPVLGLSSDDQADVQVFQGRAMGRTSRILVKRETNGSLWLSGAVTQPA